MSHASKTLSSQEPAPLTEADYKPVGTLLAEIRRQNRIGNSLVTWKNSYTLFNSLQRDFKLPASKKERQAYISCIASLQKSGNNLLAAMGDQAAEICDNAEFKLENFTACLKILDIERGGVALEDDPATLAKLNAIFGVT